MSRIQRRWYARGPGWLWVLWPLELVFALVVFWRRQWFLMRRSASYRAPVPVLVVGNISIGGTGKTPMVVSLVEFLRSRGWTPGVVSRGYGGTGPFPCVVDGRSTANTCGDEPVLIVRRTDVPMVVAPDRPKAIEMLLSRHPDIDVIISDDGLQHYAMDRDVEIVMIDGERKLGNAHLLPLGPLREPSWRLREADFVVENGGNDCAPGHFQMRLKAGQPASVVTGASRALEGTHVAAMAGIGSPERFFRMLEAMGHTVKPFPFPDHHQFSRSDFEGITLPIVMTEKDAVKCLSLVPEDAVFVPVEALLPLDFLDALDEKLRLVRRS